MDLFLKSLTIDAVDLKNFCPAGPPREKVKIKTRLGDLGPVPAPAPGLGPGPGPSSASASASGLGFGFGSRRALCSAVRQSRAARSNPSSPDGRADGDAGTAFRWPPRFTFPASTANSPRFVCLIQGP